MSSKQPLYSLVAMIFLCAANSAVAQQAAAPAVTDKNEIAYRAALGRGADIKFLISKGANPNAQNAGGIPILLVAAGRKDPDAVNAVQALLEGGANVNSKDATGQTALYYAARTGKADVVDYLLKNKIDYYSLDKNGDIARTIAYRSGHTDVVKLMDDFVKGQTLQLQSTYQDAEKMVKEQAEREAREAAKRAEEQKRMQAVEEAKQRAERARKLKEYEENLKKLDGKVYDISYNACAFQYWSFAQAADQTTVLSDEEVDETIDIHRRAVRDAAFEVMKMFGVDQGYVNKIINPSKQLIFNQLNGMPSRTYRKENGVGTLEDVDKRCHKVAKSWEIGVPKDVPVAAPPVKKPDVKQRAGAKTFPGQLQIQKLGR